MMVDDEPHILEQAKIFLERELEEIEVYPVDSPNEAISKVQEDNFDAIISDYQMPEMSGLELLREIRAITMDIPFIMFTGRGHEEVAMEALNLGADRYLRKEGDPRSLYGILASSIKQEVESSKIRRRETNIFESIQEGLCILDSERTILQVNGFMEDLFPDLVPLEGKKCYQVLFGNEEPCHRCLKDKDFSDHESYTQVLSLYDGKGNVNKWIEIGHFPQIDKETGEIDGIIVSVRDITKSKKSAEELKKERDFVNTLLQTLPVYFVAIDTAGKIRLVNQTMLNALGYKEEELLGNDYLSKCVPKSEYEDLKRVFSQIIHDYRPTFSENHILTSNGERKLVEWRGCPLLNEEGHVEYFFGVGIDITEKREKEKELNDYRHQLEELVEKRTAELTSVNKDLRSFTYSVTHDLRAPLRAIIGFTDALTEDYSDILDEVGKEYLKRIIKATKRMDLLIENLWNYSRLSRKKLRLKPVLLSKLTYKVLEDLRIETDEKGASVEVEDDLPEILAHATTLKIAISNIISNSLKFVGKGVKPEIKIWAESLSRDRVRLYFRDNGIGIKEENLEKIFEPFKRLFSRETFPGTGMGLSIAKRGVERMGGSIGVESTIGEGSTFWIELPKT